MSQKISEMNNSQSKLPPSWRWVRLGEVCETTSGGTPSRGYREYYEGSIPWVKSGELNDGFIYSTEETITELGLENSSAKLFPKETLLIALYGATVGKLGILKVGAATNQAVCAIFPNHEIDRNFLFFYLLFYRHSLLNLSFGGAQPNISQELVRTIMLPLPPLSEQKSIAAKVQELMQEVGRARTACEKQLEAAKSLPAAYLREVFESEEAKKWERKKLGEVCEVIMGQSPPGYTYNAEGKGLPFYQGKIEFGKIYLKPPSTWCTQPQKIAEPNDILISVRAPVGPTNMCNIKCCIGRGLAALRSKTATEFWFLFYCLRLIEPEISSIGQGSTFFAISKSQIQNLEIPFPSLPVQQRIASELKEKMAEVEKLRTGIEKQLEAINSFPQAILRKASRGEL